MEAKTCKDLFFTGEVLDVDGICGGYNLTWAYTSADIAANEILKRYKN
jgi:predicted flavoprotein YhiN